MSKSWNELRKNTNQRLNAEKSKSSVEGFLIALPEEQRHSQYMELATLANALYALRNDIASLQEGLINIEKRLEKLEKKLKSLETLDEHR